MSSLPSNPFATRFVSPGQVEWVGELVYVEQLALRWKALNCRASIIGVHGSGKSTLLEHFVPLIGDVIWRRDAEGHLTSGSNPSPPTPLPETGRGEKTDCGELSGKVAGRVSNEGIPQTVWLQLRRTASQTMVIPWDELSRGRLLILDGYEQLTLWRRAVLIARTKLRGVKLLVTSHRRTVLATLCELSITDSIARQIVSQLTAGRVTIDHGDFATISDEEIQRCLEAHDGNMRDVLMDFYDRYETRRELATLKVKSKS